MQPDPSILIVDSEANGRSRLRHTLDGLHAVFPHRVVGEVTDAQSALEQVNALHPSLLLVDAMLPGMNGIELARRLAEQAQVPGAGPVLAGVPAPSVIYVSGSARHALDAFEVRALDYLLKPVDGSRLLRALRRVDKTPPAPKPSGDPADAAVAASQSVVAPTHPAVGAPDRLAFEAPVARRNFAVHERGRLMLVPVEQVIYLKAELKYVTVRTRQREYLIEDSLTTLEKEFGDRFVRIHRNALVARQSIAGFERVAGQGDGGLATAEPYWQVVLRDVPERLPVSRRQWSAIRNLIG